MTQINLSQMESKALALGKQVKAFIMESKAIALGKHL
jgi:hypothetical protein